MKTLATCATSPDLVLQHQDEIIATYIWNVWNIYICNIGREGRGFWPSTRKPTNTGHARGCPWLGRGRPEVPQDVCPSHHGGVSGAPNGDGRRMNNGVVSNAGDCHAGERGRGAREPGAAGDEERKRCDGPMSTRWGRGRTNEQPHRATQVTATQVNGAGSEGTWHGQRWEKETPRRPDKRTREKG
jgi:hypothetical protein